MGRRKAKRAIRRTKATFRKRKELYSWSGVDGNVDTKGRYLCLSNGYEIWCLDLKQAERLPGVVPLPRIATLDLIGGEQQLPAAVGLFNWGPHSYMIGGQRWELHDLDSVIQWDDYPPPSAIKCYKSLCKARGIQGTSCVTRRLTLTTHGAFSASDEASGFEDLEKPKVWAIVEHVNGELHVMDSVPFNLRGPRDWIFSHEVSKLDGVGEGRRVGWAEISTIEEKQHIRSHVVVGDLIYAVTHEGSKVCYYLEFNSRTGEWRGCTEIARGWKSAFELKHVWNILALGAARCAGEFPCGPGGLEPVFALIAIVKDFTPHDYWPGTQAVAYLVTKTGRVLCHQHLPDFFQGPDLCPRKVVMECTMIQVEGGVDGPMCSVLSGTLPQDGGSKDYLFVNTFSVEMLECAAPKVREILVKKASEGEEAISPAVPLEFVRVAVKDKFIFDTENTLDVLCRVHEQFVDWRACFLTPEPPL